MPDGTYIIDLLGSAEHQAGLRRRLAGGKRHAWRQSTAVAHWREELEIFLDDAEERFTPSMRQRVGLEGLCARAASCPGGEGPVG
jgi:ABC-type phosphonate transport system ATPase subunit